MTVAVFVVLSPRLTLSSSAASTASPPQPADGRTPISLSELIYASFGRNIGSQRQTPFSFVSLMICEASALIPSWSARKQANPCVGCTISRGLRIFSMVLSSFEISFQLFHLSDDRLTAEISPSHRPVQKVKGPASERIRMATRF